MNIVYAYATDEPIATQMTTADTVVYGLLFYGLLLGIAYIVCKITGEL